MEAKKLRRKGKVWEKQRRDRLKDHFQKLAQLLPHHDPAKLPAQHEILHKAAEFVKELRLSNSRLLNQQSEADEKTKLIRGLQDEVNKLILRVKQLTALLQQAKIPIPTGPFIKSLGKRKLKFSGTIASEDIENNLKRKKCDDSAKDKNSEGSSKSNMTTEENSDAILNTNKSVEASFQKSTSTPLREANSSGNGGDKLEEVQLVIPEVITSFSGANSSATVQHHSIPTPAITLASSSAITLNTSISGPVSGFPAAFIISSPCIAPTLQQVQVASCNPILPKPLVDQPWPKIAIRRIVQPVVKVKKKRNRKKVIRCKSVDVQVQANDRETEQRSTALCGVIADGADVQGDAGSNGLGPTDSNGDQEVSLSANVDISNDPENPGEVTDTIAEISAKISDAELVEQTKEVNYSCHSKDESLAIHPPIKAVNNTAVSTDRAESLPDSVINDKPNQDIVSTSQEIENVDEASKCETESDQVQNQITLSTRGSEVDVEPNAVERVVHPEDVVDQSLEHVKDGDTAKDYGTFADLELEAKDLNQSDNSASVTEVNKSPSPAHGSPQPASFNCSTDALSSIHDTLDDIEEILTSKRSKQSISSESFEKKSNGNDKLNDSTKEPAKSYRPIVDEQLSNDKIGECIARSIDLIDQPSSELMDLSGEWGDGASPKSPMSPTKIFLSMFPLSLRENTVPPEPTASKQYTCNTGKSFHIDAMLPDDGTSSCNTPMGSNVLSAGQSMNAMANASDDYLSLVSNFVTGSCSKNTIDSFNLNLPTDMDSTEISNPFSFSLNLQPSDLNSDSTFNATSRSSISREVMSCPDNINAEPTYSRNANQNDRGGFLSLPSWVSKSVDRKLQASKSSNSSSVFSDYSNIAPLDVARSSVSHPNYANVTDEITMKKKSHSKRSDGSVRWICAQPSAEPQGSESGNRPGSELASSSNAQKTSTTMQFSISDLMGSVNQGESQVCQNPSKSHHEHPVGFSSSPLTSNQANDSSLQYKPYEDNFLVPSSHQYSHFPPATAGSAAPVASSYVPDFQANQHHYVPRNGDHTSRQFNQNSGRHCTSQVDGTVNFNVSAFVQPQVAKRNVESKSTAKVTGKAQKPSKAGSGGASRVPLSQGKSKQQDKSPNRSSDSRYTVDITRRSFETWSSNSYMYYEAASRVPATPTSNTLVTSKVSDTSPGKTRPAPTSRTDTAMYSQSSISKKSDKQRSHVTDSSSGRVARVSNTGTRTGHKMSSDAQQSPQQPKLTEKSNLKQYCVDNFAGTNFSSTNVCSFQDQHGSSRETRNQLFYLPEVGSGPNLDLFPFQHNVPPTRNYALPAEFQPSQSTSSNVAKQPIFYNVPSNLDARSQSCASTNVVHVMQNIFDQPVNNSSQVKAVQHSQMDFGSCVPPEVSRAHVSGTKKKSSGQSYQGGHDGNAGTQPSSRLHQQPNSQPHQYSVQSIASNANPSQAPAFWPRPGTGNVCSNSTKNDGSVPNTFSVSKLVGSSCSSTNDHPSTRHCVEGLIKKSGSNSSNWIDFNHGGVSNSVNNQPLISEQQPTSHTSEPSQAKVQAYQQSSVISQNSGSTYNFIPPPHHQFSHQHQHHQPYPNPSHSTSQQSFPHFNYFESTPNFISTPPHLHISPTAPQAVNEHVSRQVTGTTGRRNDVNREDCNMFPRFRHGSSQPQNSHHQQQGTSSVSNFNLSSIFPEMNQETSSANSGSNDRNLHHGAGPRDSCVSSNYFQNQRQS